MKTQFGYHIIKVVDKKPATTRPLAEVRQQIADQLAYERAQAQVTRARDDACRRASSARRPRHRREGAWAHRPGVRFFAKDEPIAGLGPAPEVASEAFLMKEGAVAGPMRVPRGQVFFTMTGKEDARIPKLDEVKDRVKTDAVREKAREVSRQRADVARGAIQDRLRRRREERRARGEDDRAHPARLAAAGHRRERRRRRRRVRARPAGA